MSAVPGGDAAGVRVIGVRGVPPVREGDDIAALAIAAAEGQGTPVLDGDALVVAQRIVSKAEGRVLPLGRFEPSPFARGWAEAWDKDPRQTEAVLRESVRVVRQLRGVLITETRHGFVCANSGVDASNVGGPDLISLLPVDPDASARAFRDAVRARTGREVAVIVSDTFGRAWRVGHVNVAIGAAGLRPLRPLEGMRDLDGRELHITTPCPADELAAAAGLEMGKSDGVPVVIVRGYRYEPGEGSAREIVRPPEGDLFP